MDERPGTATHRSAPEALTALSLAGPAMAIGATAATQVTLALSHVVAAAVVIPVIGRRLPIA